ncbi:MAG: glycosyltransferase [Acidimicrobiia bacterium]|nr:glycosyltransferase [Acidimicrobiia bacterium]
MPETHDPERDSVVLVIPCYNEATRLDVGAFTALAAEDPTVSFLFVDDGSSDNTFEVLAPMAQQNAAQIQVVRHESNRGKAEAVRTGMLAALVSHPSVVGYWDADLATPFSELEGMRRILADQADVQVVTGARINLLGRSVRRNLLRHWIGRIFATAASFVLQLPMYDTQCGAKLFRNQPWISDLFAKEFGTRWILDVEILARMSTEPIVTVAGDPRSIICEYPLDNWFDTEGSKLRLREALGAGVDLGKIFFRYRVKRR